MNSFDFFVMTISLDAVDDVKCGVHRIAVRAASHACIHMRDSSGTFVFGLRFIPFFRLSMNTFSFLQPIKWREAYIRTYRRRFRHITGTSIDGIDNGAKKRAEPYWNHLYPSPPLLLQLSRTTPNISICSTVKQQLFRVSHIYFVRRKRDGRWAGSCLFLSRRDFTYSITYIERSLAV